MPSVSAGMVQRKSTLQRRSAFKNNFQGNQEHGNCRSLGISLVRQKPEIREGHELFSTPAHALVAEMATGLGAMMSPCPG